MKKKFVTFFLNADAQEGAGGATPETKPTENKATESKPENSSVLPASFDALLKQNEQKAKAATSQTIEVTVKSVTSWRPTTTGLEVVMVTTNRGNFWPLKSACVNLPNSIDPKKGHKAFATLTIREVNGEPRLNISSLKFETSLGQSHYEAIQALPKGTALALNL